MKKCDILLATMFKNEAKNIIRMLESTYQYIDYYLFQNNGSTDGTDDLIRNYLNEKQKKYSHS